MAGRVDGRSENPAQASLIKVLPGFWKQPQPKAEAARLGKRPLNVRVQRLPKAVRWNTGLGITHALAVLAALYQKIASSLIFSITANPICQG